MLPSPCLFRRPHDGIILKTISSGWRKATETCGLRRYFSNLPPARPPHRVSPRAIGADFGDLDGAKAYLAGPPPMVSCHGNSEKTRCARKISMPTPTEAEKSQLEKQE